MHSIFHITGDAFLRRLARLSPLVLILATLEFGCEIPVNIPSKVLSLCVQDPVDFGSVPVGSEKDTTIMFVSCGGDSVSVTAQIILPPFSLISPKSDSILHLPGFDTQYVHVRFRPTDSKQYLFYDTIYSTAGTIPIQLTGRGYDTTFDFDTVIVGDIFPIIIPFTNSSPIDTLFIYQKIDSTVFSVNPRLTVPPNSTVSDTISFWPNQFGPVRSLFHITKVSLTDTTIIVDTVKGFGSIG